MAAITKPAYGQNPGVFQQEAASGKHEIRYVSGTTVYVESLQGERWVGCGWSAEGRNDIKELWTSDAFEFSVKDKPSGPAAPISSGWQFKSASELEKTDRGALHFVVRLGSKDRRFDVNVHTVLDGTPTIVRWLEIANTSERPVALTDVSPWSGRLWLEGNRFTLGHSLRSEVPWEGWFGWDDLKPGLNQFRNITDKLWDDPYFVLRNESNGEYFFAQLAWPANYSMEFVQDSGLSFKIGPTAPYALRVIAAGETITTPAVHLCHVKKDLDAVVQAMHQHIRRSVMPTRPTEKSYLIQYLIPEDWLMTVYRGNDFNETNMKKCIDVASAVGGEAFILDGPRWCSGYGNWLVPVAKLFPNGLGPLVDYAREKGMLFGLYFETEGGRDGNETLPDSEPIGTWSESKVFRDHPDWFKDTNLKLHIPEAAQYFVSELSKIIDWYHLGIYRHDANGIVFHPAGPGSGNTERDGFRESDSWRHYEAFYDAFAKTHAKYPELILQQAAAGNLRLDLATLGRFHEQFTSDRATMPWSFRMLSGMSVFLPPEVLVNANGMGFPKNLPDADTTLRGTYALGNTPMIFNAFLPKSLDDLKPDFRDKCLHYANIYKTFIRPMLADCKVWHHAPVNAAGGVESGGWFAMEFTSPDRSKGWATVIRLSGDAADAYLLKLKGLDAEKNYRVTFDNTGNVETIPGVKLMTEGLRIQPPAKPCSEFLLFECTER